jgi:glycosyltransferase involved in cell wall biosynthesis
LKLLLLIDSLGNGGAERQMALLAKHLPADCRRRVVALGGGPFEAHLRAAGVTVEVNARRSRFDPLPIVALWRDILWRRPDLVHSWSWISTLAAGPLCRLLRVPLVDGTVRTGGLQARYLWLKRFGMACASLIVANTHAGAQAWGVGPMKARVIYNGFDWSRVTDSLGVADCTEPQPKAERDGPFTVAMIGRMVPERDYDVVIAAARLLRNEGHQYRFLLVGDGAERPRLIHEAADLTGDGTVAFPEGGMEVLDYLRDADVGVLMTDPTWAQEGFSNAIMEYMACGLPVVCAESGGNRELVEDGATGFVLPPADPVALADRIAYLHSNDAERRAMGAAGRRRIEQVFSLERMVGSFLRVYEEALSERRGPRVTSF